MFSIWSGLELSGLEKCWMIERIVKHGETRAIMNVTYVSFLKN